MANNILKEAIADAKAVREVALANAKAALEEAFTPKLQSMLSAKLSEELEDEYNEETYEENSDELYFEEDEIEDTEMEDEGDLDEEIDLEDILNELELEDDDSEEEESLEEIKPGYEAKDVQYASDKAEDIHENFNLDALLQEINDLEDNEEVMEIYDDEEDMMEMDMMDMDMDMDMMEMDDMDMDMDMGMYDDDVIEELEGKSWIWVIFKGGQPVEVPEGTPGSIKQHSHTDPFTDRLPPKMRENNGGCGCNKEKYKLQETTLALKTVRNELNEVNLLNSKLLYVNRIFKANTLNEAQKLRVVETLDNASNVKEAKLIYETIKDTFTVANTNSVSKKRKTRSLREGLGMASRAAGTSTAPKKAVIAESDNMVSRFQKLANIQINQ